MRSTVARLGALTLAALMVVSAAPPRSAGAANEPYLIGATVSESGPGATLGRPEADSIQMAVDEINKAGGVNGHPLQATILDDESNPTTAVNNTRKLLDQHVVAIIGSSLTQTSLAMIPLTQAAKVPLISLASSAQVIQPTADRQWVFKMPITDFHVAQAMQEYMRKRKQTKVAVIYRDDDYGKTGLSHFKDAGKNFGFEVVAAEAINARASDATTQLTHIKAANPDAIVAWTTLPSAAVIIKAYRELGLSYPIYYSDGAATGVFPQQAGAALNGGFIASTKINVADSLPNNDPQKKLLTHYIDAFVKGYPKDAPVSIFGGFGYDSVYVLKQAIQRAKSTDGEKLRSALEHTDYLGVTGQFRMSGGDHNGLSVFSLVLTQVDNGKFKIAR
ncbi:MAG: branched-chain amino acid transport system substrate-binding protein [Candidatus Eremiobacteraeota bacterium]|nr:branched-chain amino acid transport system substrate-binding protein [Candidatus Eremiobacteraeota bacterium]